MAPPSYVNLPVDCLAEVDLSKLANKMVVITGGTHCNMNTLLVFYVPSYAKSKHSLTGSSGLGLAYVDALTSAG